MGSRNTFYFVSVLSYIAVIVKGQSITDATKTEAFLTPNGDIIVIPFNNGSVTTKVAGSAHSYTNQDATSATKNGPYLNNIAENNRIMSLLTELGVLPANTNNPPKNDSIHPETETPKNSSNSTQNIICIPFKADLNTSSTSNSSISQLCTPLANFEVLNYTNITNVTSNTSSGPELNNTSEKDSNTPRKIYIFVPPAISTIPKTNVQTIPKSESNLPPILYVVPRPKGPIIRPLSHPQNVQNTMQILPLYNFQDYRPTNRHSYPSTERTQIATPSIRPLYPIPNNPQYQSTMKPYNRLPMNPLYPSPMNPSYVPPSNTRMPQYPSSPRPYSPVPQYPPKPLYPNTNKPQMPLQPYYPTRRPINRRRPFTVRPSIPYRRRPQNVSPVRPQNHPMRRQYRAPFRQQQILPYPPQFNPHNNPMSPRKTSL